MEFVSPFKCVHARKQGCVRRPLAKCQTLNVGVLQPSRACVCGSIDLFYICGASRVLSYNYVVLCFSLPSLPLSPSSLSLLPPLSLAPLSLAPLSISLPLPFSPSVCQATCLDLSPCICANVCQQCACSATCLTAVPRVWSPLAPVCLSPGRLHPPELPCFLGNLPGDVPDPTLRITRAHLHCRDKGRRHAPLQLLIKTALATASDITGRVGVKGGRRSEEHTSELQSR